MLLLTRKPGDQIVIDGRIVVKVIDIQGGRVQLGIKAPKDVKIEASAPASPARDKGERKP
jgi:carbon storage regulator